MRSALALLVSAVAAAAAGVVSATAAAVDVAAAAVLAATAVWEAGRLGGCARHDVLQRLALGLRQAQHSEWDEGHADEAEEQQRDASAEHVLAEHPASSTSWRQTATTSDREQCAPR